MKILILISFVLFQSCSTYDFHKKHQKFIEAGKLYQSKPWLNLQPKKTPYDYDEELKEIYIKGFLEGLNYRVEQKGGIVDFFPKTFKEKAHADGFNDGQQLYFSILNKYIEENSSNPFDQTETQIEKP